MDLGRLGKNGLFVAGIMGVCLVLCTPPSYADGVNLIVNGSFEDPVVPADAQCGSFADCIGYHNGVAGNDNIGGWQLIGKSGVDGDGLALPGADATIMLLGYDYVEPDDASGGILHFHPEDGFQSVDLTGEGNQGTTNGIKQSVMTTLGESYLLSFWIGHQYSSAPGYNEGPSFITLYIDGQLVGVLGNDADIAENVHWAHFTHQFTAAGSQTVIAFLNDTPIGNNFAGLDNVSLSAVPEPSTLVLTAAGMFCMALYVGRRKRAFARACRLL